MGSFFCVLLHESCLLSCIVIVIYVDMCDHETLVTCVLSALLIYMSCHLVYAHMVRCGAHLSNLALGSSNFALRLSGKDHSRSFLNWK